MTEHTFRQSVFSALFKARVGDMLHQRTKTNYQSTVLCFHSISDSDNHAYPPMKCADFAYIMDYIAKRFQVVTLEEMQNGEKSRLPKMVLTFDDGYKDFYENALPILDRFGFPSIQSIVVESVEHGSNFWTQKLNLLMHCISDNLETFDVEIGGVPFHYRKNEGFKEFNNSVFNHLLRFPLEMRNNFISELKSKLPNCEMEVEKMMSWDEIKKCTEHKVEIANHTFSHNLLNTIYNRDEILKEVVESKRIIEEKTGQKVQTLTFPNGFYNQQIIDVCKEAGYKYLLTTRADLVPDYIQSKDGPFLIPRLLLSYNNLHENIMKIHNFHKLLKR
jgi:peptidoglycan/xylan/chitin deacetylase (PgdA/CDA1 family)